MNTPSHLSTLSSLTVQNLIDYLHVNPQFEDYLWSLQFFLENNHNITPLKTWWAENYQNLVSANVLIKFSSLLEHLQIRDTSRNPSIDGSQTSQISKKTKKPQYEYLPWTSIFEVLPTHKDNKAYIKANDLLSDYNEHLKLFSPSTSTPNNQANKKVVIEINSDEHQHLVEISKWVSKKTTIKYCQSVFDSILKIRTPSELNSGRAFKAACSCPHKLFRTFMESDFTGYNFSNGDALLHLLALPLAVTSNDYGKAHLNPEYPFFGNDIFSNNFSISSKKTLARLNIAWNKFYKKYNHLSDLYNNNRTFSGGEKLFGMTVASLVNDNEITASALMKIFNDTQPNIWCIQYWLNTFILGEDSSSVKETIWQNFDVNYVMPDFVDYFFSIAQHIYDIGKSEISSRVLVTGIIQAMYWARKEQSLALKVFKNFFPVIFNHRRTEAFRTANKYILANLQILRHDTPNNLLPYKEYLERIIDSHTHYASYNQWKNILSDLKSIEQNTKSIHSYRPRIIHYDSQSFKVQPALDYKSVATLLANNIAACLNTNGGDIIITIPLDKDNKLVWPGDIFDFAIKAIFKYNSSLFYDNLGLRGYRDKEIKTYTMWISCYRSSHPAFAIIDDASSFPVYEPATGNLIILRGIAAAKYIFEHFIIVDELEPIELII